MTRKHKSKSFVAQFFQEAADIYDERNETYGENYKRHGHVMSEMFPEGITLETPDDFNRFAMMSHIVGKMGRYAAQFDEGGHEDSVVDSANYAAMLAEIDYEAKR